MTTIHLPPDGILRAITVHEPYASMIVMGFKSLENRVWKWPEAKIPLPATIAIHASASDVAFGDEACENCMDEPAIYDAFNHPDTVPHKLGAQYFYRSCIIGLVDVIACSPCPEAKGKDFRNIVEHYEQWPITSGPARDLDRGLWAFGPQCFVLDNFRRFRKGMVCRGSQKLWRVPAEAQAMIEGGRELLTVAKSMPDIPESIDGTNIALVGKHKESDLATA